MTCFSTVVPLTTCEWEKYTIKIIVTEIFPSVHETWYLKVLIYNNKIQNIVERKREKFSSVF